MAECFYGNFIDLSWFEVAGKSYLFLIDSRKVSEYQRNLQADAIVFPSDNKRDIYYIIVDGYGVGRSLPIYMPSTIPSS